MAVDREFVNIVLARRPSNGGPKASQKHALEPKATQKHALERPRSLQKSTVFFHDTTTYNAHTEILRVQDILRYSQRTVALKRTTFHECLLA